MLLCIIYFFDILVYARLVEQGKPSGSTSLPAGEKVEADEEIAREVNVSAGSAPVSSKQSAVKAKLLAEMQPDFRRASRGQLDQVGASLHIEPIVFLLSSGLIPPGHGDFLKSVL